MFLNEISIGNKKISDNDSPYLIAEIGLNHNKDIELAKELIFAAKESGGDAVKFQSYTIDNFINKSNPKVQDLYKIFQKLELTEKEHYTLKEYADKVQIHFLSTPLSYDWVEKLNKIGVVAYKVASGDMMNFQIIKEIIKYQEPIIISTGSANFSEIEMTKSFLQLYQKNNVAFLHCVSLYPTTLDQINLCIIQHIKENISPISGFSDHTQGTLAAIYSVAIGGNIIEKHFTIDQTLEGPDHAFSSTPKEFQEIRKNIDNAYKMRGDLNLKPYPEERKGDFLGKRSMYNINGKWIALRPQVNSTTIII